MLRTTFLLSVTLLASPPDQGDDDHTAFGWKWETVKKTEHYKIYATFSGDLIERVATRQEMILEEYRSIFPKKHFPKAHDKNVFDVLLFETRKEFDDFSRSRGTDSTGAGGYFSPFYKYTVLYHGGDKELFSTLFHEAFHQFLHHILPDAKVIPRWLDEGLADFFGGAKVDEVEGTVSIEKGDVDVSEINQTKKALMTNTHIPLAQLLQAPIEEFYGSDKKSLYYSEGLSIVYFLLYWKKDKSDSGSRLLGKYIKMLRDGATPEKAYKKVFRMKIKRIERAWKKELEDMEF